MSGNILDTVIGKVNEAELTLGDLAFAIKTIPNVTVSDLLIETKLVEQAADGLGVSVTTELLQEAADEFRKSRGFLTKKETEEWLDSEDMTIDDFERQLKLDILKSGIKETLGTEQAINKNFAENMTAFDHAIVSQICVNDEGLAQELKNQIEEGEDEFAVLAAKHSTHQESAQKGGSLGIIYREDIDDALEVEAFSGDAGMKGPIKVGNSYYLLKVDEFKRGELDDHTRATIKETLMQDHLSEKGENSAISIDL